MGTKHEGTFKGIKYGPSPVTPSRDLHNTVCTLSNSAERKCGSVKKNKTKDILANKTWNTLSCGDKLNLRGEQLLCTEWIMSKSYSCHRTSSNEWYAVYDNYKQDQEFKTIYPLFHRRRKVIVKKKYFFCSCKKFERFGIPCRHILSVFRSFPLYTEPNYKDISVIYWKDYMYYAYSNHSLCDDNTKSLVSMLEKLSDSDILGPSCTRTLYSSNYESSLNLKLPSKFNISSLICKNYDTSHLAKHDIIYVPSEYGVSMSQSLVEDTNDSDMKSSSSQTEDCLSPNTSFSRKDDDGLDTKNDVLEDLSSTFDLYSIEIENTKKRKKRNSYADIMPLIKELCPLLDSDGSDN